MTPARESRASIFDDDADEMSEERTMIDARPWHAIVKPHPQPAPEPTRALAHTRRSGMRFSESLESLALDGDLRENMLPPDTRPVGPQQIRIWLTRLTRELARDYRISYGVQLRTDAHAVEQMQRHLQVLVGQARDGHVDALALTRELVRHGAMLGAILSRALDATWVELSGDLPGAWRMLVASGACVSPIAQVHSFVRNGNRERDLVAFYLDIHAAQRATG